MMKKVVSLSVCPVRDHAMIIILINNKLLAKRSYVSARHDTKTVDRYYRRPLKCLFLLLERYTTLLAFVAWYV